MKFLTLWKMTAVIAPLLLLGGCVILSEKDKNDELEKSRDIAQRIENNPDVITHRTLNIDSDYSLHYVYSPYSITKDQNKIKQKASVVFVHGTPGSWGTFSRYFEDKSFIENVQLYSIDRPGWGASGYLGKSFPVSLSDQSRLIEPILAQIWKDNNQEKMIVVGHSLGGSLVPKLAVDYPNYIKGVIVLAGDLDPELSEARWFNTVLDWVPNVLLPDMWQNSNNEVIAIRPSLEHLQKAFSTITMPITVLQGTEDTLVRPGSAEKAPMIFKSSDVEVIFLEGASHIINHTHTQDVKNAIYSMVDKTKH